MNGVGLSTIVWKVDSNDLKKKFVKRLNLKMFLLKVLKILLERNKIYTLHIQTLDLPQKHFFLNFFGLVNYGSV